MSGVTAKTVSDDEAGMRLDRWFKTHFPSVGHGMLEKFLRKGQVRVDGGRVKANRRLEAGENIRIPPLSTNEASTKRSRADAVPNEARRKEDAAALRQMTLYEDDAILALNKPFGLAVQGGTRTTKHLDGMLGALEKNGERPRLTHRLDRDTGGLILIAKTRQAAAKLGGSFQRHEVEKTYWALAAGALRTARGTIDLKIAPRMMRIGDGAQERIAPADGEDAKKAITDFQRLDEAGQGVSFLALRPVTGRKHQIRVHLAAAGAPVAGDRKYGGPAAMIGGVAERLHLFCRSMKFPHPVTGRAMTITAPLTGHMKETWAFFSFDPEAVVDWSEAPS